jgi:hypothetical protein
MSSTGQRMPYEVEGQLKPMMRSRESSPWGTSLLRSTCADVALLEGIEDSIRAGDYGYFQPVDTWVEQVALALEIVETPDLGRIFTVKHKIISSCVATGVSPSLFNADAWMVGAQAYRLLLERL